jgi:hypothetical protein
MQKEGRGVYRNDRDLFRWNRDSLCLHTNLGVLQNGKYKYDITSASLRFSLIRSMTVCTAVGRPVEGGGWAVEHRLLHDGSRLSQISAGAALADRVVLGSPFSRGVLVCGK